MCIQYVAPAPVARHALLARHANKTDGCRQALLTIRLLFEPQARRIVVYDIGLSTPQVGRWQSAHAHLFQRVEAFVLLFSIPIPSSFPRALERLHAFPLSVNEV